MTKPTSKKLLAAGALGLAAGIIGGRSVPATAGAAPTSTVGAPSAARLLAGVGAVPHDDSGDEGDGGDGGDDGDEMGTERGR